jgi:hypothetical protein
MSMERRKRAHGRREWRYMDTDHPLDANASTADSDPTARCIGYGQRPCSLSSLTFPLIVLHLISLPCISYCSISKGSSASYSRTSISSITTRISSSYYHTARGRTRAFHDRPTRSQRLSHRLHTHTLPRGHNIAHTCLLP